VFDTDPEVRPGAVLIIEEPSAAHNPFGVHDLTMGRIVRELDSFAAQVRLGMLSCSGIRQKCQVSFTLHMLFTYIIYIILYYLKGCVSLCMFSVS
jgi:hypothetical protein